MDLMLKADIKKLTDPIKYGDKIMLIGSCFTEHIGNSLSRLKFNVMQNPNGILFDPDSVARSIRHYVSNLQFTNSDLFQLNETWNSWHHHSRFSSLNAEETLQHINNSNHSAHDFIRQADWLMITLGSAFSYRLTAMATLAGLNPGDGVANCHRAPANWFEKELLPVHTIISLMEDAYKELKKINPGLKIIFTVSPVRHIRDGVIDNNRSKARLIEAVHHLVNSYPGMHYFPAYELVIDVLRDYRFYDIDLVHPNYQATEFVLEKFLEFGIDPTQQELMDDLKKIGIARRHKPFQPGTEAHKKFLDSHLQKIKSIATRHPYLDLSDELDYFSKAPLS